MTDKRAMVLLTDRQVRLVLRSVEGLMGRMPECGDLTALREVRRVFRETERELR